MNELPLFFRFQELVYGRGFVAGVAGIGRALGVLEDDEAWWFYGVEPGGLAESGETPQETYLAFRASFRGVLLDIAQDAPDFEAFASRVQEFFYAADPEDGVRWIAAAQILRSRAQAPCDDFPNLPRWSSTETKAEVIVARLDAEQSTEASPAKNLLPELAAAA